LILSRKFATFTILYCGQNFNIYLTGVLFFSTMRLYLAEWLIDLQVYPCLKPDVRRLKMADRLGQQFGNYRLVSLLGQGGYAEVYLGQHVRFNQQAAIKVMHAYLSGQEAEHFQHEAETIATLAHPSIVRVFDFDVQDGVPFLVMEYAPNGSLRRRSPRGSLMPLPQIVSSVKQVADALQYAHEQKFIHRDVKPENMLLGRREEVLLSDFGLAALAHSSASLSAQPTVGTLAYMAPEQIEGHPRAASDQYALGVVVYEWLCGERPFEGSVTEVMVKHLSMPPPPLREHVPMLPVEVEQVVLRVLAKDPKQRFPSVTDFAAALELASQVALSPTMRLPTEQTPVRVAVAPPSGVLASQAGMPTEETPTADQVAFPQLAGSPGSLQPPAEQVTPPKQAEEVAPAPDQVVPPTAAAMSMPADVPLLPKPAIPHRRGFSRTTAVMLIGLAVLVIAGGLLGSLSLLVHFGVIGTSSSPTTATAIRGGTWFDDFVADPTSLIPNGDFNYTPSGLVDQALYLPLFYGDAQGLIHPGAATVVPTLQNGGISADAKTWTFQLRPHLVWSDGQPYDARDVDYSWKLWLNPKFGALFAVGTFGYELISSADISANSLSITFHLKRAYAPFLQYWVDGAEAPLPAHHFSAMTPEQILKSPDNLNPRVTSGPFTMEESVPGDHYTLARNLRYYRFNEGLPYLDRVVFRIREGDAILKDLQAGSIDSAWFLDVSKGQEYQRLKNYTLATSPTSSTFEAMYFNFHNTVLASHLEVRAAMVMAIDQQALIDGARHGFATPLCTDHGSALHPGYDTHVYCPQFNLAAANKLLEDNGWAKGADGVRVKGGQRLEFEYSTSTEKSWRVDGEAIIQHNFMAIGIKLDFQNYIHDTFFGPFLNGGKASPPTGAVAGRYDIAEWANNFAYDPDDSSVLACDQFPPNGINWTFYCNPALDALYRQEQATLDAGVRQQIFYQIHQIYLTTVPFITLYSQLDPAIVRRGTHNYLPSPIEGETVDIWEWRCDYGKC
jgi:peptide/nickel transport system substrate-binding protein